MARDNRLGTYLAPRISKFKQEQGRMPVITTFDIERVHGLYEIFQKGEQYVSHAQCVVPARTVMVGYKDYFKPKPQIYSERTEGYLGMLEGTVDMFDRTDWLISFNGNSFDIPKIEAALKEARCFTPYSPFVSIDLYREDNRGHESSKLADLGLAYGIGQKIVNEPGLWRAVREGNIAAYKKMEKYCMQDVVVTENLYDYLRPWLKRAPSLSVYTGEYGCYACGSKHLIDAGWYKSKTTAYGRLQCNDCGAWNRKVHTKNKIITKRAS